MAGRQQNQRGQVSRLSPDSVFTRWIFIENLSHADGQQCKFSRLGGHVAGVSNGIWGNPDKILAHRGGQERNSTLQGIGLKKIPLKFSSRPCRALADAVNHLADIRARAKPRRK